MSAACVLSAADRSDVLSSLTDVLNIAMESKANDYEITEIANKLKETHDKLSSVTEKQIGNPLLIITNLIKERHPSIGRIRSYDLPEDCALFFAALCNAKRSASQLRMLNVRIVDFRPWNVMDLWTRDPDAPAKAAPSLELYKVLRDWVVKELGKRHLGASKSKRDLKTQKMPVFKDTFGEYADKLITMNAVLATALEYSLTKEEFLFSLPLSNTENLATDLDEFSNFLQTSYVASIDEDVLAGLSDSDSEIVSFVEEGLPDDAPTRATFKQFLRFRRWRRHEDLRLDFFTRMYERACAVFEDVIGRTDAVVDALPDSTELQCDPRYHVVLSEDMFFDQFQLLYTKWKPYERKRRRGV